MGGVPKKRHTKGSRNQRRMHLFLEKPNMTVCKKCGKPVMSHIVCPACGFYKGKEVIDVLSKLDRRQRRAKEMEIAKTQAESEVAAKQTAK
ncbi:MAG: 50S ribosomal protein L32 [Minisyncoccales bacterium]|nr:MAG: 50S ribosomal protein L32 [Candidatus Nealsonbacteria bacterium DGGOD1a]